MPVYQLIVLLLLVLPDALGVPVVHCPELGVQVLGDRDRHARTRHYYWRQLAVLLCCLLTHAGAFPGAGRPVSLISAR